MLMGNRALSAEQRLNKAVVDIMSSPKYVALASVMMIGERAVKDGIPTACTNGRDEYYGREFVEGLNDAQLRFLILHEVYHKLYRHLTTWRKLFDIDADCANRACDYVINLKITNDNKDGFATMPQGGCLDSKYEGMTSAEVFNQLMEDSDDNGNTANRGQPLDEHDWDGAKDMSEQEAKALEREIDEALRQGAMAAGKIGGAGLRDLDGLLTPQVDWREVLREFISATCTGSDYSTWTKPNRRYIGAGMYMPSGISEQVGELVVAIDTSGSIGQRELTVFLSEVVGIADTVNPESVRLLYWGSSVVGDEVYESHELGSIASSTKPNDGGGTDVNCVTQYIAQKSINAQAVIVLTDGYLYGGWGQWTAPVLWCINDNTSAKPPVGKYVHIKSGGI